MNRPDFGVPWAVAGKRRDPGQEIRKYFDRKTGYDGNAYTMTSTYYPDVVMTLYTLHALEGNRDKVIWTNFA